MRIRTVRLRFLFAEEIMPRNASIHIGCGIKESLSG